jgi:hypothetical protein
MNHHEPENAIFSSLEFSKTPYGKTAESGSYGSYGSCLPVDSIPPVPDVEEF